MTCTTCGVDQTTPDDEHHCDGDAPATPAGRPNRPPLGWRALTLLVLGTTAAHTIATIVSIGLVVADYRFTKRFMADPTGFSLDELTRMADRAETAGLVIGSLTVAHLATYVLWAIVTPRTVMGYNGGRRTTAAHWTLTAWWIGTGAHVLFSISMDDKGPMDFAGADQALNAALGYDRLILVSHLLEFPLVVLLVTGVYIVTRRLYELAAEQPAPHAPSVPGSRTLPRTAR